MWHKLGRGYYLANGRYSTSCIQIYPSPMRSLTLGKFMPLHTGHQALIAFALTQATQLTVLLCAEVSEPISGDDQERWLRATYADDLRITIQRFDFADADLPATSVSSCSVSELWTARLKELAPDTELIIGSEAYVQYVAESWGIKYRIL